VTFWTAEKDKQLQELEAAGLSAAQIADRLGTTRNAVIGRSVRPRGLIFPSQLQNDEANGRCTRHACANKRNALPPGWPGYPGGVYLNWSEYSSCSQWWSNDPGHISSVTGFTPGSSIVDGTVNWWVDANCSGILYWGTILLTGPVGLPYY
jgi:hypothetical protein